MTVYTQEMLDAVKKAYASGTLRLTYEGKTLEYRSLSEMEKIINTVQRELNAAAGTVKSKQVRFKTGRGV
ncbi:MAG: phage head-tail joining protein [Micavibrio sp.]